MSQVFVISRPGVDVSSTDPRDFVLHSDYPTFKAKQRATTTITLLAGNFSVTKLIGHGLAYAPLCMAMAEMNPGKWYNINSMTNIGIDSDPGFAYNMIVATDSADIQFVLQSGVSFGTNKTYNISYYTIIDQI